MLSSSADVSRLPSKFISLLAPAAALLGKKEISCGGHMVWMIAKVAGHDYGYNIMCLSMRGYPVQVV